MVEPGAALAVEPDVETETAPYPETTGDAQRDESVVIQAGSVSAVVLSTPLIASVARRGPVDVVVRGAAASVLENNPSIRRLFRYERAPEDFTDLSALWRTLRAVRGRRTTEVTSARRDRRARRVAYVADSSMRSALLALLAGIEERVGFAAAPGGALYTRRVRYEEGRHHAERLAALAAPEGAARPTPLQLRPRLFPSASEVGAVDALLAKAKVDGDPLVAIAVGAGRPTKQWPGFAALAARLARRAHLVMVGSREDASYANAVREAAGGERALDASGQLSLLASAELIGRCVLLIANDSTPVHLAAAMGTPTIAIFGPTVPEFGFGPLAPRSHTIGHGALWCRPCDRRGPQRCPLGHWRCMREISPDDVERLIEQSTLHPPV